MTIIVCGHGKMAKLLEETCSHRGITAYNLDYVEDNLGGRITDRSDLVAVHVGKRQLEDLIRFCSSESSPIPILQGSTGMEKTLELNKQLIKCPIVNANNFIIPIMRLISDQLPSLGQTLGSLGLEVHIAESHQKSKDSVAGTANLMADALGLSRSEVEKIRGHAVQHALGVTASALDGHGYHYVSWFGNGIRIKLTTEVDGRDAYISYALMIAATMNKFRNVMKSGVQELTEFLKWSGLCK